MSGAVVVLQDGESVRPPGVGALTPQARADRGAAQTPGHQGHVALLHLQWSDIEFPVMFILTDLTWSKIKINSFKNYQFIGWLAYQYHTSPATTKTSRFNGFRKHLCDLSQAVVVTVYCMRR